MKKTLFTYLVYIYPYVSLFVYIYIIYIYILYIYILYIYILYIYYIYYIYIHIHYTHTYTFMHIYVYSVYVLYVGTYSFFKVLKIKCRSPSSQSFPDRCDQDGDHWIKCFWYVYSMSAKYSKKITYLIPWYTHVHVRIRT